MTVDVAVIGGGVSGLATAYRLHRRGRSVVVLERRVQPGGCAVSERAEGFLMEHGPSSVNASSDQATAMSLDLGLDGGRCDLGAGVRRRYLVSDGALSGISIGSLGFLTSPYLSVRARLRLMGEFLVPGGHTGQDESVADFCRRRFGAEFVDRVIDPLVGGMFAGKAAELSMAATFPKLCDMERRHGSIMRAMILSRLAGGRSPERRLFSWRDGIASLPSALAARLGAALRTGIAVRRIVPRATGFRLEAGAAGALDAKAVVIATQPHVTAALLETVDADAAAAAAAIEAPPLAVVFLGYRRDQVGHPLDGLGYLTPAGEQRALSGALFCSTMFANRAPEGHVAVAGYIGGARAPDPGRMKAEDLIALARDEFSSLLAIRGAPVFARTRVWSRGLPQYRVGHRALVGALSEFEAGQAGLFLTGNYLRGVSVAACLDQAARTAGRIDAFLGAAAAARAVSPPAAPSPWAGATGG